MITDAIAKLADRADLSEKEAEEVMLEIMTGAATSAQIAAYLMGLRIKVETVDEIVGSVRAMRSRATHIRVADPLVWTPAEPAAIGRTPSTSRPRPPLWWQAAA